MWGRYDNDHHYLIGEEIMSTQNENRRKARHLALKFGNWLNVA